MTSLQRARTLPFILSLAFAVSACAGPVATVQTPALRLSEETGFSVPSSAARSATIAWWTAFDSSELNSTIDQLVTDNPDIAAATLRIAQSILSLRNTRSQTDPRVTAGAQASATSAEDIAGSRSTTQNGQITTTVSWEADLYGRLAAEGDAAAASLGAAGYDRDALVNTLIANAIRSYIDIAFTHRDIEATRRIIASREISFRVTQDRFNIGLDGTDAGTVKSAEENLAAARSDLPRQELALVQANNALDVLQGNVPNSDRAYQGQMPRSLPAMPAIGTPADLLDERPDIRAAAARLQAANANIRVSVADRFPTLTLSGTLSSSGESLGDILNVDAIVASLIADLVLTVFDSGRGSRLVAIRRAEAEELAETYVSTVLTAIREVEDALVAERYLLEQSRLLRTRLNAARDAADIASNRYQDGTGTYLTLLDASRAQDSAETAYLAVERSRWLTRVDLMLALGGQWTPSAEAQPNVGQAQ